MKPLGRFITLLVIWWAAYMFALLSPSFHLEGFQLALMITLFFGTMYAIPSIIYLTATEYISNKISFPWNVPIFILLVLCGCVVLLAFDVYHRGFHFPPTSESGYLRQRFTAPLIVAGFLLVRQILKSIPQTQRS